MAFLKFINSKLIKSCSSFLKVAELRIDTGVKKLKHMLFTLICPSIIVACKWLLGFSYNTGKNTCNVLSWASEFCYCKFGHAVISLVVSIKRNAIELFKKIIWQAINPLLKAVKKGNSFKIRAVTAFKMPLVEAIKEYFCLFKDMLGFIFHLTVGLLNYIIPVVAVYALVLTINSYTEMLNYAVAVEYNGQLLGYIAEDVVFDDALEVLQQKMMDDQGKGEIDFHPEFSLAIVSEGEIMDASELSNHILSASDFDVVESTGVYIDGVMMGALTDATQLNNDIEAILAPYKIGAEGEIAGFVQDISLVSGLYPINSIVDYGVISDIIHSEKSVQVNYTVVSGDAPITIASKNNISLSDLIELNPTIESKLWPGDVLLISKSIPYLSVKVLRNETYLENIPYGTRATSDRTYYVGYTKVITPGILGQQEVNANITYVDGEKASTEVLSAKLLSEPVDETVIKGSLPVSGYSTSRGSSAIAASVSTGSFGWPVGGDGGKVTCGWWGYYGHRGMDIASKYGTAIVASDAGVVYKVGWDSIGYGKYVIIDHGNGIKTLYAHNSTVCVKEGETVSKGQPISAMGSSGNSSGNHCHFEVIVNGVKKNPALYLG